MTLIQRGLGLLTALSACAPALAGNGPDNYPVKPVTLVVPFAPGGGSDNIARYVASRLGERMGSPVIIDNRPGAGTNIGNELAARAKGDGYTLLFGQVTLSINPYVYKNLKYSVAKDFVPVAHLANSPTVLLTNRDLGVKDVRGFVKHVQDHPGAVNYGSGGTGTSVHLAGYLFNSITRLDMTHVPYKGSGPAMTDLIGGQIQAMFDTAPSAVPQAGAGARVVALAVTGKTRLDALPDVPTFAEAGYPAFDAPAWYGVLAPTGTPASVVTYLNQQVNRVLEEPETRKRFVQLGATAAGGTPADFGAFLRTEAARWESVVKSANVTPD
ncbi:Bug family tripartite tricarboxylate transporter substrate binding protein [Pigmentiphaga litoralis]|uniref:Bug family tripartite tricarboxylate transporter substrate binding protein n=1 Tax=Pigmentiphaga litoralis TaxID=516702 RepID=UPI003B437D5B